MSLWPTGEEQREINNIIIRGARSAASIEQIINIEINDWKRSEKRKWMDIGARYYRNKTDIDDRVRTVIGQSGALEVVGNLANNKLANGFVRKLVDQKVSYLLGKPLTIQGDNETYQEELETHFNKAMLRRLQSTKKEAVNKGIAWWHVYYDEESKLCFKKMNSEEIIPLWADEDHTILDAIIRVYTVEVYEGLKRTTSEKVEFWDLNGVRRYTTGATGFVPDVEAGAIGSHFLASDGKEEKALNWERIPFIAWKYNEEEQSLVELIKSLVDDYDEKKSDNSNNLEDLPNSIYVVKNYAGTNGGEFRRNISQYRTAFVDGDGGIETVGIEIDTEAYKNHQEQNRKDIYEFGRGVDTQGVEIGSAPSGIALRFLYSDLDLDCSMVETEFQASLEQLRWFIDTHIHNTTGTDYSAEEVEFIFNKDMPIDEAAIITGIKDSVGILSDETLIAQHPYVTDVQAELKRVKLQREKELEDLDPYRDANKEPNAPKPSGVED
ncbi:phage portal protein [Paenibacillus sp. L3-i20]|uniref:phage portal protein n=1 Tax=Paenibacillus sp. L3-i20 TaxID=2905833 RepID=UPI001EDE941D|nr:phage portal protein [Paenibacillus sp. L3-i20]GKU79870.1 portal protein [Paenibacillus sp. L3-i20]